MGVRTADWHPAPPLDRARAAWLAARNDALLTATPRMATLRARLLAVGGHEVAFIQAEPHVEALLARGTWRTGTRVRVRLATPNACHANAAQSWCADPEQVVIETGYALSADGVWVSHSWIRRRGRVEESTARRVGYFGVRLTPMESVRFALANSHAPAVAAALRQRPRWIATLRDHLAGWPVETAPPVVRTPAARAHRARRARPD